MLNLRFTLAWLAVTWTGVLVAQETVVKSPLMFHTPEADAIVSKLQVFPPDNAWNLDIRSWPVATNSAALIQNMGPTLKLRSNHDMAYMLVPANQPRVPVKITDYAHESDPGPYPVPDDLPIEGWPREYQQRRRGVLLTLRDVQMDKLNEGSDRHAIIVDVENRKLYEFYQMKRTATGWQAAQASIFDLTSNRTRPDGWTSADAAGLPIFPGVVRYDEIQKGEITHAIRFTTPKTRRAYIHPATHFASQLNDPHLPRMGERLRLRADFDVRPFSPEAQVVLKALQKHGMILADNGIAWGMSFTPDPRMKEIHDELRKVTGKELEVVSSPK